MEWMLAWMRGEQDEGCIWNLVGLHSFIGIQKEYG